MVTQKPGFAVPFVFHSCRGKLQSWNVTHSVVRQDSPELVLDELGQLFSEEGGMLHGGAMAPPLDKGV
jgi:hypothetical protein